MSEPSPQSPRVTIGVAAYNNPAGLKKTLQCLINQTFTDIHIIVSDDCSPNLETKSIGQHYAVLDSRVTFIRQPENLGQIPNFKYLYNKAKSEYFMWASDDDEWEPAYVEECVSVLDANNSIASVFCHFRTRDPRTNKIVSHDYFDKIACESPDIIRRSRQCILYSSSGGWVYGLHRKKWMGHWFFERRFGNDHLFLLSMAYHGSIYISPRVLFTKSLYGMGFRRESFHQYYDSKFKKILVNISSTVMWAYEYFAYLWLDARYTRRQKIILGIYVVIRFLNPRYYRRLAGDFLALFTRPGIWSFLKA